MDFEFTPEHEAFCQEVADFLDIEGPAEWQKRKVSFFDMSSQDNWIALYREMNSVLATPIII